MKQFVLRENVLSDDVLSISDKGRIFKGGYIAIAQVNTFLCEWSDKCTIKRFRTIPTLNKFLKKNYPDAEIDFTDTCLDGGTFLHSFKI
jgi:hypothetical protein